LALGLEPADQRVALIRSATLLNYVTYYEMKRLVVASWPTQRCLNWSQARMAKLVCL
jgi:hypothetical protein